MVFITKQYSWIVFLARISNSILKRLSSFLAVISSHSSVASQIERAISKNCQHAGSAQKCLYWALRESYDGEYLKEESVMHTVSKSMSHLTKNLVIYFITAWKTFCFLGKNFIANLTGGDLKICLSVSWFLEH